MKVQINNSSILKSKRNVYFLFLLILSISFFNENILAQSNYCTFDQNMNQMMEEPGMYQIMEDNENAMQNMMAGNPQAIMNNAVYVIPTVFHIIHLGESVGVGSNISDAQVQQALQDLNDDFRDVAGVGYDVEVEFCLAQQDPDGNNSTGINRVNGAGVSNYSSIGIAPGANETDVKGLSIWPNTDYLNIWIVHNIASGTSGSILGYATFPGAAPSVDGIVLRSNATGVSFYSGVIAHEAGHFFSLYHTFQGGSQTACPINNDCTTDGDKVCDTPPHLLVYGGCNTTGMNICDGNSSLSLVVHNHMNYTSNACRTEFTPDQAMRIRCSLMSLRPSLMNSIGCQPGCTSTIADFDVSNTEINLGETINFTSTSTGATSYKWILDGQQVSASPNYNNTFDIGGIYHVCLEVTGPGCVDRKCVSITVIPVCQQIDPCDIVVNGQFEQIDGTDVNDFTAVCGWLKIQSSPFYCNGNINNAIGLWLKGTSDIERITSEEEVPLTQGNTYTVSFDYWVTRASPKSVQIAMVPDQNVSTSYGSGLPAGSQIIAELNSPTIDDLSQTNHECYDLNAQFHSASFTFTHNDANNQYLSLTGEGSSSTSIVFIDNLRINICEGQCNAVPDFTFETENCSTSFVGTNSGDPGVLSWDFGDGSIATGSVVSHEYLWDDTFTVCLTISCDLESSVTICKDVVIENDCNQCEEITTIDATLCQPSGDTLDTYLTNFEIEIPKGYGPCVEGKLFVGVDNVNSNVNSYDIDTDSDPDNDIVSISVNLTTSTSYDIEANGPVGHTTFCSPDGEMICYVFSVSGSTCESCEEVNSVASCTDEAFPEGVYNYEGTIDITLPDDYRPCGDISTNVNLEVGSPIQTGNTMSIPYSMETEKEGFFGETAILCFENEDSEQICVTVTITIDEPCLPPPVDCAREWITKNMSCSESKDGLTEFNISNMVAEAGSYTICEDGLYGTVSGGQVNVNYGYMNGNNLVFDITIIMPDDYDQNAEHDVRLFLCDEEGTMVCFLFPYNLRCRDSRPIKGDVKDGTFGGGLVTVIKPKLVNPESEIKETTISVFPNPTKDILTININSKDNDILQYSILDINGTRLISNRMLLEIGNNAVNIFTDHLSSGVYFLQMNTNQDKYNEKIVVAK